MERAFESAKTAGCQYIGASATAIASQTLFQKVQTVFQLYKTQFQMGFRVIRELPFSCFREDGVLVYQNLPDGGRSGKLMVLELDRSEEDDDLK